LKDAVFAVDPMPDFVPFAGTVKADEVARPEP